MKITENAVMMIVTLRERERLVTVLNGMIMTLPSRKRIPLA